MCGGGDGMWWIQYNPTGSLHDLIQPLVVCGEGGAAHWGGGGEDVLEPG